MATAKLNRAPEVKVHDWAGVKVGTIVKGKKVPIDYLVVDNDAGRLSLIVPGTKTGRIDGRARIYEYPASENDRLYVFPGTPKVTPGKVESFTLELTPREAVVITAMLGAARGGNMYSVYAALVALPGLRAARPCAALSLPTIDLDHLHHAIEAATARLLSAA